MSLELFLYCSALHRAFSPLLSECPPAGHATDKAMVFTCQEVVAKQQIWLSQEGKSDWLLTKMRKMAHEFATGKQILNQNSQSAASAAERVKE